MRAGADPAPYHRRWLVDAGSGGRTDPCLRRASAGRVSRAGGVADPVRRLRGLAAPVDGWRRARAPAGLLGLPPGRRAAFAGVARRPAATAATEPSWPAHRHPVAGGARRGPAAARPGRAEHVVHAAAGVVPGAPASLQRAGRHSRRRTHRQPQSRGNRGAHRLLRQHPGAARRTRRTTAVPRAAAAGPAGGGGSAGPPGPAVRATGGCVAAGTQPQPCAVVPGDVQPPARRSSRLALRRSGRTRGRGPGLGRTDRAVRPDPGYLRVLPWPACRTDLCHRSLRRVERRAHRRPLAEPAPVDRRPAGRAHRRAETSGRGRSARRPAAMEPPSAGLPPGVLPAPPDRAPGRRASAGDGGGLRRTRARLWRAEPAGQSPGSPADRTRCRPRRAGRPGGRAQPGDDRRPAGYPQGRRRLCPARSALST
ncbi:Pyoverdine sidechain non-ribosomal peptide synthetase [Pseudomonas paraeruginosa]|nr:Pyoverdine sidechain non-ribosomal peptide synthetase [Pseudomonas aeruginosa]